MRRPVVGRARTARAMVAPGVIRHDTHALCPPFLGISAETMPPVTHDNDLKGEKRPKGIWPRNVALPLLTWQILYLSQGEGMDGAQISAFLGLPRHVVRRHLAAAVAALASR